MNLKADLHTHTIYSDGILTPSELMQKAKAVGLDALSITDHDTFEGYLNAKDIAGDFDIILIPGCEFSTLHKGKEYHLLAYNFDINNSKINELVKSYKKIRLDRAKAIHEKLYNLGIKFDFNLIIEQNPKSQIARPHFARLMKELGFVDNFKEAFDKYLHTGGPADQLKEAPEIQDVIKIIHSAHGKAVIAHPSDKVSTKILYEFIHFGLDGIEVVHPLHNEAIQRKLRTFANTHWLLSTGGSDYHGSKDYEVTTIGRFISPECNFISMKKTLFT